MSEIVNLRQKRKAKARADKETQAAANRAFFGTPKVLRTLAKTKTEQDARKLDGHRLHPADDSVE